jgi:Ran GTPase-activating protein (RanGAP) involved in mRNA processing and transport
LACLTALTHLDLGDAHIDRRPTDFIVSDEGARALASLVSLTHLDLSGSQLSDDGLRALCSLTALTHLNLSAVAAPFSDEVVSALCSLPSLSKLQLLEVANLSEAALSVLEKSSIIVLTD